MSRNPEYIDWTRRLLRGLVNPHRSGTGQAAALRWIDRLVLLDSWVPASHRPSSSPAARSDLLVEWTRSSDLTEAQAGALLTLDETTSWQV